MKKKYNQQFIDNIIDMAWTDNISFDKIKKDQGLSESEVIIIMRQCLKTSSFKLWRKRVTGRHSKHEKKMQLLTNIANQQGCFND